MIVEVVVDDPRGTRAVHDAIRVVDLAIDVERPCERVAGYTARPKLFVPPRPLDGRASVPFDICIVTWQMVEELYFSSPD